MDKSLKNQHSVPCVDVMTHKGFDLLLFIQPWTLSPLCFISDAHTLSNTLTQNVLMPFTLRLCLYAASSTDGTKSSVGSPLSSAKPGGYQDRTRTPGDAQKLMSLIILPLRKTLVKPHRAPTADVQNAN